MRNYKFLIFLAAAAFIVAAQSCKKGFLEGVNDNPNSPTEVTPKVLLPGAEGALAYSMGGDVERFAAIMTQYVTGASRQFYGYNQYVFTEEDFNNLWNNMYNGTMMNFNNIMLYADAHLGGYDAYRGVADILMAYSLGVTTDVWGDIAYTQAFKGNANLQPAYDTQEEIYNSMQSLLDEGISMLTDGSGDDDLDVPGDNDFIYSGDPASWVAFAHALKARYYIHLVNVDPSAAQKALDEISAGGPIADALYPFSSAGPAPWFQYIEQRDDIIYDGSCLQLMQANGDPRYAVYIDTGGVYWGVGYLGPFFSADNSPIMLMTEFERKFIEAEAELRINGVGAAQGPFTEAIQASMDFYGIGPAEADAYIAAHGTIQGASFDEQLEFIMTEKWIANFLSPESWTDVRRTGFPVLVPNSGSNIPTRFIYPTNERLYNPNSVNQNSNMFSPQMWWM